MKSRWIIAFLAVFALFLGCQPMVKVTFDGGEGIDPVLLEVIEGEAIGIEEVQEPAKTGYYFLGWGNATDSKEPIAFPVTIGQATTYFAIWLKEIDEKYFKIVNMKDPSGSVDAPLADTLDFNSDADFNVEFRKSVIDFVLPKTVGGKSYEAVSVAFWGDDFENMRSFIMPNNVKYLFDNFLVTDSPKIEELILSNQLETINRFSFQEIGIKELNIPDSVTFIGEKAFRGSPNLEIINFGIGLENVESQVFGECPNLVNVILPKSLKTISLDCFDSCFELRSLTFPSPNVVKDFNPRNTPNTSAKDDLDGFPLFESIFVPANLVEAYKADPFWFSSSDKIKAIVE